MTEHRVIIVGAGPAGLTAAIYAARANMNPLVAAGEVQATEMPGGQLMLTTEVENFPGFPEGIQGPDLMEKFMEQAKRFKATIIEEYATEFELKDGGPFKVKVGDTWHETDTVILANGASARWLNAPDEDKFRNRGISACATCDGPLPVFRNKPIFVIGGGDSAVEESIFLTKFASKVSLIHRRDELRASRIMRQKAKDNPKIDVMWDSVVVGYHGEDFLEAVDIRNVKTEEVTKHPVSGVFMAIGHDPNTKYLKESGVKLDEQGYIVVHDNVHTNIEGVFAAGDVHDTYYRQAITAAGFGCQAAITAERWLEEKETGTSIYK
ncbi:MAG: thioredoxin-disulfide reductase [Candidatus Hodarchaeales archaeon]|jgi:thioredoxin reductase (NADPH)